MNLPPRWLTPLLAVCVIASGAAGLIYEVAWARMLGIFLGATAAAHGILLASFMAGLALGNAVLGPWLDRRPHRALASYAVLEVIVGVYGLLSPVLYLVGGRLFEQVTASASPESSLWVPKLALSVLFVVIPTMAMGGTLPALVRFLVRDVGDVGRDVARLYLWNTLGAAAGAFGAGIILMPALGARGSVGFAAALNLCVALATGIVAWRNWNPELEDEEFDHAEAPAATSEQATRKGEVATESARPSGDPFSGGPLSDQNWKEDGEKCSSESNFGNSQTHGKTHPPQRAAYSSRQRWLFVVVAMTGFASLVLEVAWVRVFSMVFGSSAQAFTLMLTAFILGIALGSAVASALMKRQLDPARVLVGLLACSVLLLTVQLPFYERLAFWQFKVAQALERRAEIYPLYLASQCAMAFAWMLPATIATGAALPVAVLAFTRRVEETGASVGRLFAANTVGTVLGPLVASFLLMPWLGIQGAIKLSIFILALAAVAVALRVRPASVPSGRWALRIAAGAVLVSGIASLVPRWDANEMHAGGFRRWTLEEGASFEEFERTRHRSEVLFETDGITDSVIVVRNRAGHIFMKVNGKTDASDDADLPTQRMVAHIPLLLHRASQLSDGASDRPEGGWFDTRAATASSAAPGPVPLLVEPPPERDVYIVGVGSGTTVGAASRHTNVQVTAYDISEGILEGSRFFSHINEAYYDRDNVHYGLGDARERLRRTPNTWDVIINQPSNPWIAGNAALFSHEFFELGRDRLDDGGVFAQWMHVYAMDDASLELVMNTFLDVFPYVTVWWPQEVDLVLIGSMEPLEFTESALATAMRELDMRDEVASYDREGVRLNSMERLLAIQILSEAGVREAFPGTPPFTTDLAPQLEFLAPVAQFVGQRTNRFVELDERQTPGERTRLWLGMRERWDRADLLPFLNERNTPFALRLAGSMTHATTSYPPSPAAYAEYVQHATGLPVVFETWTERMLVPADTPSGVACREYIDTAIDALSGRATVFYRPPLDRVSLVITRCADAHPDQSIVFDALHAELLASTGYSTEADRRIDALLALGLPEEVRDLLLELRSEPLDSR